MVIALFFTSAVHLRADISLSTTYQKFRDFVTKDWKPTPDQKELISEFLEEQLSILHSIAANSTFWQEQEKKYISKGQLEKSGCVQTQLAAIKSTSALARTYEQKIGAFREVETVTPQLFDDLTQVGRVAQAMTRLHDVMSQCMMDVDLREMSLKMQNELYSLSRRGRLPVHRFQTEIPFTPTRRPFR